MKLLQRPVVWFPAALLILAAVGSYVLRDERCLRLSERDRYSYGSRPVWQASFDALSATCGVGLLMHNLHSEYTAPGRWALAALGVIGAAFYLVAARQVAARIWTVSGATPPGALRILLVFCAWQAILVVVVLAVERFGSGGTADREATVWQTVCAFSSLGWSLDKPGEGHTAIFAAVALLGALGWAVWLLVTPKGIRAARAGLAAGVSSYLVFLVLCAGLVTALETPRDGPHGELRPDGALTEQTAGVRFVRGLVQVANASGAGVSTEALGERRVGEGTLFVLALVVLVGGLGGAAGGGIRWSMLLCGLQSGVALSGYGAGRSQHEAARRGLLAAVICVGASVTLALIVALGLLLIDAHTGSRFQTPPTFAAALLDASSAVGGAALTTGVVATVTSVNLSIGMTQTVDLYQYGMGWLMLAMFIGRVLPVLVLDRVAALRFSDKPPRLLPLV
jgi:hypothetical protein